MITADLSRLSLVPVPQDEACALILQLLLRQCVYRPPPFLLIQLYYTNHSLFTSPSIQLPAFEQL